jgi:Uma2 family endonuclease
MAKRVEDEVVYYYDFHPTEEDLMGETSVHAALIHYLVEVLRWLFHGQVCAVYENLNFYQTPNPKEYPLAPDIAVIKGVTFRHVRSWRVGKTGPAPQVVFEIASEETWLKDLQEKPMKYALMGVEEYFVYDPNDPPLGRATGHRLFGWQLDKSKQVMREMPVELGGRLWSPQLDSFLAPGGEYLRLYDRNGQQRLTEAETEASHAPSNPLTLISNCSINQCCEAAASFVCRGTLARFVKTL